MSGETSPRGWVWTTIGDVSAYIQRGKSPVYVDHSELPVVNQKCIRWDGLDKRFLKFVDPMQWGKWSQERFLHNRDVLLNSTGTGTIGRATLFDNAMPYARMVADSHVTVIRVASGCEAEYVKYYIQSPNVQVAITEMQTGSTNQVELGLGAVCSTEMPLAPTEEQRRIIRMVEELTTRSRRAREALDAVPALLDRYRQSVLAAAFRGDLSRDWREGSAGGVSSSPVCAPLEELPSLPDGWEWIPLPKLGELARGKSRHRPRNDPRLFGGQYPFVQTGDVAAADGVLEKFNVTYSDFGLSQSRLWPVGTVCITIAANIAETAILGIEACFPDSVVGLVVNAKSVLPEFIEYFIRTAKADLERFAPATAQKNINLETLNNVYVPVPPIEEQRYIVCEVQSRMKVVRGLSKAVTASAKQLSTLDQSILAKAFRGELVPQDPNDEPASVLLERIRRERAAAGPVRRGRK